MRIAVYHNLPSGGAKRALYEWIRRLARSRRLDVYTLTTADHDFCDIRPFVGQHRVFGFTPHRLFTSPWGRLNQLQRWRDLGELTDLSQRIAREMNTGHYDVAFVHPCQYTIIPIVLRFVRIPSVYYLHEPFGPTFVRDLSRQHSDIPSLWREVAGRLDPLPVLYRHRLERSRRESVNRTTRLLANSEFTRWHIKLQYDVDAHVCRCGVNTRDFRPDPDVRKDNSVISVGELTPRKGFDFVIGGLGRLPRDGRPTLTIAANWADPAERLYLEELAAHNDVEMQVRVNLDTEQLRREYNRAQLCVYAPVAEPLGLVPLESMACGTPVVGVAEGGVCETVLDGKTGLLTERNPQEFAEAISCLLKDSGLRAQYGRQGRAYVEREWQWDRSVRALETHLLDAAMRASGQPP